MYLKIQKDVGDKRYIRKPPGRFEQLTWRFLFLQTIKEVRGRLLLVQELAIIHMLSGHLQIYGVKLI